MSAHERVAAYLDQLENGQRGLDREQITNLNGCPLLASDLRALLAEPTDQRETRTEWGVRRNHGVEGPYWQWQAESVAMARGGTIVRREVGPWVEAPDPSP